MACLTALCVPLASCFHGHELTSHACLLSAVLGKETAREMKALGAGANMTDLEHGSTCCTGRTGVAYFRLCVRNILRTLSGCSVVDLLA